MRKWLGRHDCVYVGLLALTWSLVVGVVVLVVYKGVTDCLNGVEESCLW